MCCGWRVELALVSRGQRLHRADPPRAGDATAAVGGAAADAAAATGTGFDSRQRGRESKDRGHEDNLDAESLVSKHGGGFCAQGRWWCCGGGNDGQWEANERAHTSA